VEEQVFQGGVRAETVRRLDHAGHEDILEIGGFPHDDGQQ